MANGTPIASGTPLTEGDRITLVALPAAGYQMKDGFRVTFVHFVRGDVKFDSLEALKAQLTHDQEVVDQLLN